MKVLDLFSGIGGFSLGLERAGMETVAFCEIDKRCSDVLRKNWPKVNVYRDIKKLSAKYSKLLESYWWMDDIDLICGGYPCKGHSAAGKKEGFKNEESGLWVEYLRIVKETMPKYCILENSPNLRNTGLAEMLVAFNEVGYNAEWSIISAYSVGAPHQRERFYCVFWRKDISYCDPFRWFRFNPEKEKSQSNWWAGRRIKRSPLFKQASKIESKVLQFTDGLSEKPHIIKVEEEIKQLGNSLLPQIPELIGRAIMAHEKEMK